MFKANKTRGTKVAYISAIVSTSLVLFMLGLLGLIILHAKKLSDYAKENIGISLILQPNAPLSEVKTLQKDLEGEPYVKSTQYITKEAAARQLQEDLGEDFVSFMGFNPLLSSIDIRLKADFATTYYAQLLENKVLQNSIIKEMHYQRDLISLVNENVRKISLVILSFSAVFLLIAFVLINNTIRLSVFSKRFLIRTMQLVGARYSFIRKPFMLQSLLNGFVSAIVALFLLLAVIVFLQREMSGFFDLNDLNIYLILFLGELFFGVVISYISTYLAVNKYLKLKTNELY